MPKKIDLYSIDELTLNKAIRHDFNLALTDDKEDQFVMVCKESLLATAKDLEEDADAIDYLEFEGKIQAISLGSEEEFMLDCWGNQPITDEELYKEIRGGKM